MRLKTLRKERPAFENEGAVISGSRMDLSNSEFKPPKHRTNNSFALPTSLNSDVSSLNLSPSINNLEKHTNHPQQTSTHRTFHFPTPSEPSHVSSYQAIEAAYLEHGIRIHLNSTAAAAVTQQQNLTTENLNRRKSANSIQRHKAFVNRNPSRSSSALHYTATVHDTNQDSRPFSAVQQTSTVDFEQINTHNVSCAQQIENQNQLQLSQQLNNNYYASSILTSEHSHHMTLPTQLAITSNTTSTATLINNDPDLAYMSTLLQTTSGDSFRDAIRRRAGLRATFAVHRHPQSSIISTTTTSNSKLYDKSPVLQSPTANHRSSLLRNSTIAVVPTTTTPSSKKIEKDILKHASRIRTNRMKDSSVYHQNSLRSQTIEHISSVSNSPTRTNYQHKQNKILKQSQSMSLEPLELLLSHSPCSLSPPPPSPARATSLSLYDCPVINRNEHQEDIKLSKKRTKSPKILFVENNNNNTHDGIKTNFFLNEHLKPLFLNDENSPLMKNSPLDMIKNDKTRQSNSLDSGWYDRSSNSGDTHSVTSLSIYQPSSSVPSARLTSASTRRSNINKKVSFEDQSSTFIVTTATYV